MVMTNNKWFNEKDGEQAFPSELSLDLDHRESDRPLFASGPLPCGSDGTRSRGADVRLIVAMGIVKCRGVSEVPPSDRCRTVFALPTTADPLDHFASPFLEL